MNNPQNNLKSRFTYRFFRALTKINAKKPVSPRDMFRRYRRIKVASDKSMAYSVRSRANWRRAMLRKLRKRRMKRTSNLFPVAKNEGGFSVDQEGELRELVPGGEYMDLCNLLDETAHYIKCLTTQVQVMRTIADFYSI